MLKIKNIHLEIQILKLKIAIKIPFILVFINRQRVKNILKKIYNPKSIIVLGDSHTDIFNFNRYNDKLIIYGNSLNTYVHFNYYKNFITYHLGPVTAYNSNKEKSTTKCMKNVKFLIKNGFIPKNAVCVCVFGEIDCRVHIQKQSEKLGIPIENVIEKTIANYLEFLKFLENQGIRVIVYGPIPSQPDNINIDFKFPRYGTQQKRNTITKIFNEKLKEMCNLNNYRYVSLFDKLLNSDFSTKEEFLNEKDFVHLGTNAFPLLEELFK